MYHLFSYNRDTFLKHYHKRSNVETTFSMIKPKFGDAVLSKSDTAQMNEVLAKVRRTTSASSSELSTNSGSNLSSTQPELRLNQ